MGQKPTNTKTIFLNHKKEPDPKQIPDQELITNQQCPHNQETPNISQFQRIHRPQPDPQNKLVAQAHHNLWSG
jgi:hypothetical protein